MISVYWKFVLIGVVGYELMFVFVVVSFLYISISKLEE
jgi:hypothetical protein